ncbi:GntR family transcriptional regulator [Halanaerocella petrolearia]
MILSAMELNENSPIPLYYQLENIIRERIEKEEYQVGDKIPSLTELSKKFNLSKMTISKAINNLVEEGVLYRERGKGTFVSEEKIDDFSDFKGFKKTMKSRGVEPETKVLSQEIVCPKEIICNKLEISKEEKVILTVRLRLADSIPIAFEKSFIPHSVCSRLLEIDLAKNSIYNTLKKNGYKLTGTVQEIEAIESDKYLSDLLEMEIGKPVLKRNSVTFAQDKRVEFSFNFYPGDRYSIISKSTSS